MSGFGSNCSELAFAKGSRRDDKAARDAKRNTLDAIEHAKVRRRSGGRCEVRIFAVRCKRSAVHDHHRFGGNGRRNRTAESLSHRNRLHMCLQDHRDEHEKRLQPERWDDADWAGSVEWERT